MENEFFEYSVIEKHKYPQWVMALLVLISLVFISIVPWFLLKDLPIHYVLSERIEEARQHFISQHYEKAAEIYIRLLKQYPHFKAARIEAVKAYFLLGHDNSHYLTIGFDLLSNFSFSENEVAEMAEFLPIKYKEEFKAAFTYKESTDFPFKLGA